MRSRPAAAILTSVLALSGLGACGSAKKLVPLRLERPPVTRETAAELPDGSQAVVETQGPDDWVLLDSGEWLRGKLLYVDRETLVFDSKKLGEQHLGLAGVAELRTERVFTVLYEDGSDAIGRIRLDREHMWMTAADGVTSVLREAVTRIVPGEPRESNYWSGSLELGLTARRGNTDQTDTMGSLRLMRRTAASRLPIQFDATYSELSGVENADNQRLHTQYDRFLTRRLYLTPLGFDALRDPFQNIALRATPFTGLGYTLVDHPRLEWDADVG
ncbi:MAG TPA: DUF481 domain-containing protein, partial [Planctomycetota bacterium]|nr:DUF481 domain-containing protein [Planctomycetota bacterium]